MMYGIRPEIVRILEAMGTDEKKNLLEYLERSIQIEEQEPAKSYLEENWAEIKRLMRELDLEPYIDDQVEIAEIWEICEEMIGSGRLKDEEWSVRKKVLSEIIEGEYFDFYGVIDPMMDLQKALCCTREERIFYADMVFERGSGFMKKEAAKIYLEDGEPEKYYAYCEGCLGKDGSAYWELIKYYRDRDKEKALELARLAMEKCKENLTEVVIFLLEDAREKEDTLRYQKLMKSAKLRYAIRYTEVLEAMGGTTGPVN